MSQFSNKKASSACAALLPFLLIRPLAFLVAVAVWSGFAGGIYSIALSIIGDHAQGAELARGNASMGVVYAAGSPLDTLESHGLIVSACVAMAVFVCAAACLQLGAFAGRQHDA